MRDLIGKTMDVGDYVIVAECLPITTRIGVLRIKKILENIEDEFCLVTDASVPYNEWNSSSTSERADRVFKISNEDAMLYLFGN